MRRVRERAGNWLRSRRDWVRSKGDDFVPSVLASCALGLAVTGMMLLSRVPASVDFILPRFPFFGFYEVFIRVQQSAALRGALSWLGLLSLAGAGLLVLWRALRRIKKREKSYAAAAACVVGGIFLAAMTRGSISVLLDVVRNAWFPPQNMDIREPLVVLLGVTALTFLTVRAALFLFEAGLSGRGGEHDSRKDAARMGRIVPAVLGNGVGRRGMRRWVRPALWSGAVFLCWVGALCVSVSHDAHLTLAEAAGIPSGPTERRTLIVLTEAETPEYEVRTVSLGRPGRGDASRASLERLEDYAAIERSVHAGAALRQAYTGYAALGDAIRMRRVALKAYLAGDPLARLLLLSNLSHAPVTWHNAAMLDGLAYQDRWRIGPHAAVMLAIAYRHLQRPERAAYWLETASDGAAAIPPGLLSLPESGKPSGIEGRLEGAEGVVVCLYARDPALPAEVGPMTLVDSAKPGKTGAFRFADIAPGDYFLTLLLPREVDESRVKVTGHRGDIRVSGKDVVLPALTLRK